MAGIVPTTQMNYSLTDFNNTRNTSSDVKQVRERPMYNIVFDTLLIITGIIALCINGAVFVLFSKKPYLKTATNYILLSLAASDMLAGLLVVPLYVTCVVIFHPTVCFSFDLSQRLVALSNIFHLAAVTAERYICIIYPLHSPRLMTKKRINITICSIWFVSLLITMIQLTWSHLCPLEPTVVHHCFYKYDLAYDLSCVVLTFLLPLIAMSYADIRMLLVVIKQSKLINKQQIQSTSRGKTTHHYRAVVTFTIMLVTFTLCWSFFFLMPALHVLPLYMPRWLDDTQFFLRFCSPFVNPIIYIFFKHDFKRAFISLIWKHLGWGNPSASAYTDAHGSTSLMMRRRDP